MNILFLNTYQPTSNASGGIARVTCNLGNLFTENGHRCSVAYYHESNGQVEGCFEKTVQLTFRQEQPLLEKLAASYDVFIIQIQMTKAYLHLAPVFGDIRKRFGTKIIYCHHSVPFAESAGYDLQYFRFLLFHSSLSFKERFKWSFWCLYSLLFPGLSIRKIAGRRQLITDNVDRVVLLSESFVPVFRKHVNCADDKVIGIGNCCTFREKLPLEELESKEKTVLIVANMNEHAKRISTMLHIWKTVSSRYPEARQWKLVLVGDGPDLDYYRRLAEKLHLANCTFTGKQDPQPYYRKSSVLMMASAFEGFGMVILEAQQMGCVPVVYNSYESVHDLIEDGRNGLLIPNKKQGEYVRQLVKLMTDSDMRHDMAVNCINMDNHFDSNSIYAQWKNLFDSIENQTDRL